MAGCCLDGHCCSTQELNSPAWRRALWIALAVNAGMFLTEIVAGVAAGSAALQSRSRWSARSSRARIWSRVKPRSRERRMKLSRPRCSAV